jgi:DNA polymerase delta subunit 2
MSARADNPQLGGETARYVDRVLDVRQGELCWVVGTVYMEMNMKPNVLDDISKEVCISLSLPSYCRANIR